MKYLFIFAIMSIIGWLLETVYRSIVSKKFINPGLMLGCSLPVYGFGGIILNILADLKLNTNFYLNVLLLSLLAAFLLTLIPTFSDFFHHFSTNLSKNSINIPLSYKISFFGSGGKSSARTKAKRL